MDEPVISFQKIKVVTEKSEIKTDKNIVLCVDIFYIGGLTFLLSVSRRLNMFMVS